MKTAFPLIAALLLTASCGDEYRHQITVTYPGGSYGQLWADQPADSVVFLTFDSYTATSGDAWIAVNPNYASATIPNGYDVIYSVALPLTFSANATGETRVGTVSIRNYGDDWDQTVTASFVQYPWLNISRPSPGYTYDQSKGYLTEASFELRDSAMQATDTLAFTVYSDWELSVAEGSFVKPEEGKAAGTAGTFNVPLAVEPNESGEERTAQLKLTSNADTRVTTTITLTQEGSIE